MPIALEFCDSSADVLGNFDGLLGFVIEGDHRCLRVDNGGVVLAVDLVDEVEAFSAETIHAHANRQHIVVNGGAEVTAVNIALNDRERGKVGDVKKREDVVDTDSFEVGDIGRIVDMLQCVQITKGNGVGVSKWKLVGAHIYEFRLTNDD